MGCDIHGWVEVCVDGEWTAAKDLSSYRVTYGPDGEEMHFREDEEWATIDHAMRPRSRNYTLFYAIAGVRYASGDIVPLDPRGVPDDVSAPVKEAIDRWDEDGHSHTWLTMEEARKYWGLYAQDSESPVPVTYFVPNKLMAKLCEQNPARLVLWFDN